MADGATVQATVQARFEALRPFLDERTRRLWAAAEALALGPGGVTAVAAATGLMSHTIRTGLRELQAATPGAGATVGPAQRWRVRAPGGGRRFLTAQYPTLVRDLESLVEPVTGDDLMPPLRWTCKSTRQLAAELGQQGHRVSHQTVAALLRGLDYSLEGNRKTGERTGLPDRHAQWAHISAQIQAFQRRGEPVLLVETKTTELAGDLTNGGHEWRPEGQSEGARLHAPIGCEPGQAIPDVGYDVAVNQGWVNATTDRDTPAFAVQSALRWWEQLGRLAYPESTELLVTAAGGGGRGSRARLWKTALQRLADETGLRIAVCHLPPGTRKWNTTEHRLFCHITQNWQGHPLLSHEVIVQLIGSLTTRAGPTYRADLDTHVHPRGIKAIDTDRAAARLAPAATRGAWNYAISPRQRPRSRGVS